MAFLCVFFFWDSYDLNVGAFHIVPEVPEVVLISFDSFFFFFPLLRVPCYLHLFPKLDWLLPANETVLKKKIVIILYLA